MRILLAEDERELSHALVTILKHNHYSVDPVYNGEDALIYLDAENYDGAILDIMMPKVDGITVLKKIREKGSHLPILMLTAKSEVDDRVLGLDCGADDYLTKPFATKELLARVRAMLRRQSEVTESVLSYGNTTLNRITFELACNNHAVRLANKEFQIIEMFLLNPKQLISANRLFEKVWGYDNESEMNVVWVYISALRKKMADINANITIKATRNIGYSLEEK